MSRRLAVVGFALCLPLTAVLASVARFTASDGHAAAPVARSTPTRAPSRRTAATEAEVRAVVQRYVDGLTRNDVALLQQAFLPDAKLWFVGRSGALGHLTQQGWYRSVRANAGKTEAVKARIVSVDITNDVAMAKVVEEWPAERYTDYLSLVRAEGGWKIADKVYTTERR